MNHILRDIKLSELTGTPLSEEASKVVKFWDELWVDMKVQIDAEKGEIRCWKEEYDYYYFTQYSKNYFLWCDCEKVWSFFEKELGLDYHEIKEFIQHMVNKTLNCVVNTPCYFKNTNRKVDKTLNCVVNTPRSFSHYGIFMVDKRT